MGDPEVDEQGRPGFWLLADTPDEVRLPPFTMPAHVGEFRLARVFDPSTGDGRPRVDPARGTLTDDERRRVLGFLESAAPIVSSVVRSTDLLAPRRIGAVPHGYRTDGVWIWPDAVAYYLRWHGVAPEPDFLAHVRTCDYVPVTVDDEAVREAARAALADADDRHDAEIRRWQRETGQSEADARFPAEIRERLAAIGWRPGRDESAAVDAWLAREAERLPGDYRPSDAARRVLAEFGGLRSRDNAAGVTSARVPFEVFPTAGREENLRYDAATVTDYGRRHLGMGAFQVGTIEGGAALLLVADDGSVHFAGDVERYAGPSFDEALVAMLRGDLPADDPYEFDPFA